MSGFEEYTSTIRAYDLPEFFDCLGEDDLKQAYEAGRAARQEQDAQIAETANIRNNNAASSRKHIAKAIREAE